MNFKSILALSLAATSSTLLAQTEEKARIQYVLILPDEKSPEQVKPTEHCPFTKQLEVVKGNNADSEHNLIMNTLLSLKASGISTGRDGITVMLGGLQLRAGMLVPNVIPNQTVKVRVNSVTPQAIDFRWEDDKMIKRGLTAATFSTKLDLSPSITVMLRGATAPDKDGKSVGSPLTRLPPTMFVQEVPQPLEKIADTNPPPRAILIDEPKTTAKPKPKTEVAKATQPTEVPEAPAKPQVERKPDPAATAASKVLDLFLKKPVPTEAKKPSSTQP
jgi:hypothetical protein